MSSSRCSTSYASPQHEELLDARGRGVRLPEVASPVLLRMRWARLIFFRVCHPCTSVELSFVACDRPPVKSENFMSRECVTGAPYTTDNPLNAWRDARVQIRRRLIVSWSGRSGRRGHPHIRADGADTPAEGPPADCRRSARRRAFPATLSTRVRGRLMKVPTQTRLESTSYYECHGPGSAVGSLLAATSRWHVTRATRRPATVRGHGAAAAAREPSTRRRPRRPTLRRPTLRRRRTPRGRRRLPDLLNTMLSSYTGRAGGGAATPAPHARSAPHHRRVGRGWGGRGGARGGRGYGAVRVSTERPALARPASSAPSGGSGRRAARAPRARSAPPCGRVGRGQGGRGGARGSRGWAGARRGARCKRAGRYGALVRADQSRASPPGAGKHNAPPHRLRGRARDYSEARNATDIRARGITGLAARHTVVS